MNNPPVWTNKSIKQHSKHHLIMICQCCGRRFEIVKTLAVNKFGVRRRFFNKDHELRWYNIGGQRGVVWNNVKVGIKGGKEK